ncbi:autotransporter domain-containing protein [Hahella sp. NBU794]|uniref:autotransporter family protein n=1 Tax=Hahella sp. NBU794 TaxID=3422590 RepID=UPI003D6E174F
MTLRLRSLLCSTLFLLLNCIASHSLAATAVNDSYIVDPGGGQEKLVVTYNDTIDISTQEAINAAKITSVSALSNSSAGSVAIDTDDNLSVNLVPNPSFSGTVTFTYTLQDIRGTSTATVTVDLTVEAGSLQAVNDKYLAGREAITIFPLENDVKPSGNPSEFTIDTPEQGSITQLSGISGLYKYTPPSDLTEPTDVVLNYTVTYEGVGSSTATVTISVDPDSEPLLAGAKDEEQEQLAGVLQAACDANSAGIVRETDATFQATCNALTALSDSERADALEQILLRQIGAQAGAMKEAAASQVKSLGDRLSNLRNGSTGLSLVGLRTEVQGQNFSVGKLLGVTGTGGAAGDDESMFADNRLGVFLSGSLIFGDADAHGDQRAYDYDAQQLLAGVDYRFTNKLILGISAGYTTTDSEENNSVTKLETDTWNLAFYGNYYPRDNWYFDWIAGYGGVSIDSTRAVNFPGVTSTSKGDTDGDQWNAAMGTGINYQVQQWQVDAFLNIEYRTVNVDAYSESNDAGLGLDVMEYSTDLMTGTLGARVSQALSYNFGVLIPQLELAFVNELKNDPTEIEAQLSIFPEAGSFKLQTEEADKTYMNAGLSLTGVFKSGTSAYVRYGTDFARDNLSTDVWQAGVRMELGGPQAESGVFHTLEGQSIAPGIMLGTLGAGISVTIPLHDLSWNMRGMVNGFSHSVDRSLDDVDYDIDIDLESYGLIMDWHPFDGGFRVSGGLFSNRNEFTGTATPTENVEIGDFTFTPEQVGTLHAKIDYDRAISPYLGIGWGNAVAPTKGWGFNADLGILFTDTAQAHLSADSPAADANPALKAQLESELAKEEDNINNDDLDNAKYWPVIAIGVSYQF